MSVALTSFAIFAASQVGTPGPANMALLSAGAKFGFRRAVPFMAGVALGKQLVIWPLGFGLLALADTAPSLFAAMKWVAAAYIFWLAWRIAGMQLSPSSTGSRPFSFWLGLLIHPLNPKAWAMIIAGFTAFTAPQTPAFEATLTIALVLFLLQLILHPIWTFAGDRIAATVSGTMAERYLMWTLAGLTVLSVLFVLFGGAAK